MIFNEEYLNQFMFEPESKAQEQLNRDFPGYSVKVNENCTEFRDSNGTLIATITNRVVS